MSVPPVGSSSSSTSNQVTASSPQQTVSLSQFMKLLSSEMSNQDPLQPMDPTQTMSQLAQFTTLQQMSQISQTQGLAAANSYLGLQVAVPTGSGANKSYALGTVTGIDTSGVAGGSLPQLIVGGASQEYPMTSVAQVQVAAPAATTPPANAGTGN